MEGFQALMLFGTVATFLVLFLKRLHIGSTLAYLLTGVCLAPFLLQILRTPSFNLCAQIGMLLMLFMIGLDLPLKKLKSLRLYVFGLGASQLVFVTSFLILIVPYFLQIKIYNTLLVGWALAFSSTVLVLQLLQENAELSSRYGRISLGVLLFQDISVILVMFLTSINNEASWLSALVLLFIAIAFFFRAYIISFLKLIISNGETLSLVSLCFLLIIAFITDKAGLSAELGALLAGVLLSDSYQKTDIEDKLETLKQIFLGIFFISIGSMVNFDFLIENWTIVFALTFIVMFGKCFVTTLAIRLFSIPFVSVQIPFISALKVGLVLSGCGEFAFVLLNQLYLLEVLNWSQYELLIVSVILSIFITPLTIALAKFISSFVSEQHVDTNAELKNHVVMIGFNKVGRVLADIFIHASVPYLVVDHSLQRVEANRRKYNIFYGDVVRKQVRELLAIDRCKAIIVTLGSPSLSVHAVNLLARYYPNKPICVRIKDDFHTAKIKHSNVYLGMPETVEAGRQLGVTALQTIGFSSNEAEEILNSYIKDTNEDSQ